MAQPHREMAETRARTLTAATPFRFYTSFVLQEATGLRASTLPQLVQLLREVPEACIYHHTHYFLLSHHYLTPEPTNDFAYWVTEVLKEEALGELLASVDTLQYGTLDDLRGALVNTIERYLERNRFAHLKFVSEGEEFFFVKSIQVVAPTRLVVSTLEEFTKALQQISLSSLYFHIFDARLRAGRASNDFSRWLDEQLGETDLANEIAALDPYAHTLETLRSMLIVLSRRRLEDLAAHIHVVP